MFVDAGVFGGACGTLFDLTPKQVLGLVNGEQDHEALDEEKPLSSLAVAGTWVLQTLSHHATNADDWIVYMNEVRSLEGRLLRLRGLSLPSASRCLPHLVTPSSLHHHYIFISSSPIIISSFLHDLPLAPHARS